MGSPSPPAPIRAASVADPILIIALVFIPARMEGDASGRKIFRSRALGFKANTSAASIPLALDTAVKDGRIKEGDLLLLEGIGGGLAWGASLVRW